MKAAKVLIIDDEADIRELLEITLQRMGVETQSAENLAHAQHYLQKNQYQLCLLDMRLPDGDGLDFLPQILQIQAKLPVVIITAHGSTISAVKAMKLGAFDFLSKPIDLGNLRLLIESALKVNTAPKKERRMRNTLLGESQTMCDLRGKIAKIARSQAPVYINGESGTGKELVARLIHKQSARSSAPFIAVNCGAIPHELMESEFFGHKKGSFTGAHDNKVGLFQAANGGTLFLDEVADLPLHLQVKLLRAIQEKKIRPVGRHEEESIDIHLLSATHKDLAQLVHDNLFRQDLYYRINVIELNVPALRERAEDIPLLIQHFLTKLINHQPDIKLSKQAIKALQKYSFPGNVRELENILERTVALHEQGDISEQDLNLQNHSSHTSNQANHAVSNNSLEEYLEGIEKQLISDVLEQNNGDKISTAEQLGMSFRSLRYRLKN
ncbi:MAG: sigma-54 dependent transcriptional regulator [Methyloprofundus sp.]|nr:sigma-54 dependent transcriptional regulator [Methyloprofundus sp.]